VKCEICLGDITNGCMPDECVGGCALDRPDYTMARDYELDFSDETPPPLPKDYVDPDDAYWEENHGESQDTYD
jgi:hypothetical protein